MCKYEMDLVCIVEDTERTDGWKEVQTDKVKPDPPPINFVDAEGNAHTYIYINIYIYIYV